MMGLRKDGWKSLTSRSSDDRNCVVQRTVKRKETMEKDGRLCESGWRTNEEKEKEKGKYSKV